jgi:hypothetical protein
MAAVRRQSILFAKTEAFMAFSFLGSIIWEKPLRRSGDPLVLHFITRLLRKATDTEKNDHFGQVKIKNDKK